MAAAMAVEDRFSRRTFCRLAVDLVANLATVLRGDLNMYSNRFGSRRNGPHPSDILQSNPACRLTSNRPHHRRANQLQMRNARQNTPALHNMVRQEKLRAVQARAEPLPAQVRGVLMQQRMQQHRPDHTALGGNWLA